MAGIRGAKNPVPVKKPDATGVFKQRGSGSSFMHSDVKSGAMASDRKGPTKGRNSGTSPGSSHYTNMGLKRGTAK
jgi:hypothetical protein